MGKRCRHRVPESVYMRLKHRRRRKRVKCRLCGRQYKSITPDHLRLHGVTLEEYIDRFGRETLTSEERRFAVACKGIRRSSEELLAEIRRLAEGGTRLYACQMQYSHARLYRQASHRFGTWLQAVEAAGLDRSHHTKISPLYRWNRQRVVEAIRARVRRGLRMHAEGVKRDDGPLLGAGVHYFGRWGNALRAADLDPEDYSYGKRWSKDRIFAAIRERVAQGKPLNSLAVIRDHGALYQGAFTRFGGWEAALTAAGLDADKIRLFRRWSKASVLAEIQKLRAEGQPLHCTAVLARVRGLISAGRKHFGQWDNALRAAGLAPGGIRQSPPPWTRERLVCYIRQRARGGQPLNAGAIMPQSVASAGARIFGSWAKALAAAGVDPSAARVKRKWDRRETLRSIRKYHASGTDLSYSAMMQVDHKLVRAGDVLYGSWPRALRRAGVDPEPFIRRPKWTRRTILRAILADRAAGKPLNAEAVRDHINVEAAARIFGSWDQALAAAGLDPAQVRLNRHWTDEAVVRALKKRYAQGKSMIRRDVLADNRSLASAGTHYFGNWTKALEAIGLDPLVHRGCPPHWTRETVVKAIRKCARGGRPVSSMKVEPPSVYKAALRFFGSWEAASRAALGVGGGSQSS